MKFDIQFEETILSRCLKDQTFLKKASPLLESHHFATQHHAWIWRTVKSIWETYREKPNGRLLVSRAKTDFVKDEDRLIHLELIKKISKKKATAAHATLAELTEFVRFVNAQRVLEESASLLEKHKINEAWDVLNKASRQDVTPQDYVIVKWIEEFKQRQLDRKYKKDHPEEAPRIPTPFKRLNRVLGGGIEVEELGLVIATTGKGKSITLGNLAYHSAAVGFPTVYFTLEMKAAQIAQRLDSRWTTYEYNKFKNFDFLPSELRRIDQKHKNAIKRFGGKLIVVEMPVRKTTVPDLVRCLDDLEQDLGFIPKMVVVDSGDHMSASRRYESYRLDQADVFWGLKWLGQERHAAVWSSSQAGKEFAKGIADAESVSESYDKGRIADLVLSLNTPEKKSRSTVVVSDDEDEDGAPVAVGRQLLMHLGKYRDGEDKINIPIDAQFARMYVTEMEEE
jgi:replicative DNA helicase